MDFLNNNLDEVCHICGKEVLDQVISAIGYIYHPTCFKCVKCNMCLDGLKFTSDSHKNVFCILDYLKLHAPLCSKCNQFILPLEESEEIVRVVAMNKNYHIDCFKCQDCDMQLTDEEGKQCFPLDDCLFCFKCRSRRKSYDIPNVYYLKENRRKCPNSNLFYIPECNIRNNKLKITTSLSNAQPEFNNMDQQVAFSLHNRNKSNNLNQCNNAIFYKDNHDQLIEMKTYLKTNGKALSKNHKTTTRSKLLPEYGDDRENSWNSFTESSNISLNYFDRNSLSNSPNFSLSTNNECNSVVNHNLSFNQSGGKICSCNLCISTVDDSNLSNSSRSMKLNCSLCSPADCCSSVFLNSSKVNNKKDCPLRDTSFLDDNLLSSDLRKLNLSSSNSKLTVRKNCNSEVLLNDNGQKFYPLSISKKGDILNHNSLFNIKNQCTNDNIFNNNHNDSIESDENSLYRNQNRHTPSNSNNINLDLNIDKHNFHYFKCHNKYINCKIPNNLKRSMSENTNISITPADIYENKTKPICSPINSNMLNLKSHNSDKKVQLNYFDMCK